jgi:acetolactate synthase I/II/III large subunit
MPDAQPHAVEDAAEALLVLLLAHGASQVFLNPGTDTFPIQEAWARRRERGLDTPEAVMCLHEHTAVSAAHGCFLGSGQPQSVMVHVEHGRCAVVDAVLAPIGAAREPSGAARELSRPAHEPLGATR